MWELIKNILAFALRFKGGFKEGKAFPLLSYKRVTGTLGKGTYAESRACSLSLKSFSPLLSASE